MTGYPSDRLQKVLALLVRELKVRWKKCYVSLFVLGVAYGVTEEGLMVKSFFDPGWMDLGILGVYGRWWDVNWVWAEWLTIYHVIFSIVIPITLVELIFPDMRNKPWLSNRKLVWITVLLCAVTAFGYVFLTPYRPPVLHYLLSVILVGAMFLFAWQLPNTTGKKGQLKPCSSSRLTLFGFFISLTFFLVWSRTPHHWPSPSPHVAGHSSRLHNFWCTKTICMD